MNFQLSPTKRTPAILLNADTGEFRITGRSLPEDPQDFYQPVIDWIDNYKLNPRPSTRFEFDLDYFNTASSVVFANVLQIVAALPQASILWYYGEEEEDVEELGNMLKEIAGDAVQLVSKE